MNDYWYSGSLIRLTCSIGSLRRSMKQISLSASTDKFTIHHAVHVQPKAGCTDADTAANTWFIDHAPWFLFEMLCWCVCRSQPLNKLLPVSFSKRLIPIKDLGTAIPFIASRVGPKSRLLQISWRRSLQLLLLISSGIRWQEGWNVCFAKAPFSPRFAPWSAVNTSIVSSIRWWSFNACIILPTCSSIHSTIA